MENELVKYKIKGREVTFYLTTDEDLLEIKSKNFFGDIFVFLFSISVGGIVSIQLAMATSIIVTDAQRILSILSSVFIVSSVITGLLSGYFYWTSFRVISKIKKSGEIKSLNTPSTEEIGDSGLQIVSAFYWTPKNYKDITKRIQDNIVENKLSIFVSNALVDNDDPEWGVIKKLTITYKLNGVLFQREYKEGDSVDLP